MCAAPQDVLATIDAQTAYHESTSVDQVLVVEPSTGLRGQVELVGAKNAVLAIMASLILTEGISTLTNVPNSHDVRQMIQLLRDLGAHVTFDVHKHQLEVDTTFLCKYTVSPAIMKKMRASVLVMGPLLARFGRADIAMPGGCLIGARPIDIHLKNFEKMGVVLSQEAEFLNAKADALTATHLVLEYPSVGATENLLMAAVKTRGITRLINAALEPEVLDLISVMMAMGAKINILAPATIEIEGVSTLKPVNHAVMYDRLEAGSLLIAVAVTGGQVTLPQARWDHMDVFLFKLEEMGHHVLRGPNGVGITLVATREPRAVSFTTAPYPGFPTDLQAPMMVAQCFARGQSVIHETVFENRFLHVRELQKMGAQITIKGDRAYVSGVEELYGAKVIATDIRASCALAIAGLKAKGQTVITGLQHWQRGYEALEQKIGQLGGMIRLETTNQIS
ncbi:MAG: UDP-N-acetylglucosamine 1-carboxyvinyltransferase [Candidatus Babeliales bacterium]